MKIWEDEKQVYIRAAMERNTPEQNAALKERLERIDWSILEHIQRKETVNERGVFAPLEAVEVPEIEARRDEFKAAGLDAIHDTVHEMARDEARHGKAFEGLLKRYFG